MKKIIPLLFLIFVFLYPIPYTLYPAYAVDIGGNFGFGKLTSLGKITSMLMPAVFSIATAMVVIYFLFGAYEYISAGGDKEGIDKAKKKITHGIIGFIILMFSFLVLQFLLSALFNIELKIIG